MKGKPKIYILYEYKLNIYLTELWSVDSVVKQSQKMNKIAHISVCDFRIWPPNFLKGLTQNSTLKLKVDIQFYVHSENFMKKY